MDNRMKVRSEVVSAAQELAKRMGYVQASLRCLANAVTQQNRIQSTGRWGDANLTLMGAVVGEVLNQMCLIDGLVCDEDVLAGSFDCSGLRDFGLLPLIDCLRLAIDEVGSAAADTNEANPLHLKWLPKGGYVSHYDVVRVCKLAIERMTEFEERCELIGIFEVADGRRSVEPVAA